MIYYGCPKCGVPMSSPDSMAGQSETCPECGNVTTVRAQPAPAAVPPAAAPVAPTTVVVQQAAPARTKGASGLGVAALVLGILALVLCWIPVINVASFVFGGLGIVLGAAGLLVSLLGRRSGVGMPVAGFVLSVIAVVLTTAMYGALAAAIDSTLPGAGTQPATGPAD